MSYFKTASKPVYLVEVFNFTFLNSFFFHLKNFFSLSASCYLFHYKVLNDPFFTVFEAEVHSYSGKQA